MAVGLYYVTCEFISLYPSASHNLGKVSAIREQSGLSRRASLAIFPIQTPSTVVKTDQCIEVFHYRALNTER